MSRDDFFPPTPDVQHLPTLFRRIQQGEIRVPAFQRGFVWREAQIVELLESVYRGFPIGSLLFWSVKEEVLKIEKTAIFPFPFVPVHYPTKFLLDGLQRISTLYGVFHWPDASIPGQYNVIFDLDGEEFSHHDGGKMPARSVHLSSLFSPRDFLQAQSSLSLEPDAEALMERAIRLHSIFQEYMIPTVTIENRTVSDVVSMFERVNSTGTRLNAVDFMRAVTWSATFDLNTELAKTFDKFADKDFRVNLETLMKALAVTEGMDPEPSAMLALRSLSADELHSGMSRLRQTIEKARLFLLTHFEIRSYEYLPYEGQFLALIKFLDMGGEGNSYAVGEIIRWIWVTSFSEELRGKPDHYVTRILSKVGQLLNGDEDALLTRLNLTTDQLIERRFIKGKALSAAFVWLFAKNKARSLFSGKIIPPELYMREFNNRNFGGLLGLEDLRMSLGTQVVSKKLFANTCLFLEDEILVSEYLPTKDMIDVCVRANVSASMESFESQFISPPALKAALNGDYLNFLDIRATAILQAIANLTARP